MANPKYDRLSFHLLAGVTGHVPRQLRPGMSRFIPSLLEYDTAMDVASFDKCWADARAHAAGRDNKYDTRWKEMPANQASGSPC
jgi:protein gp37